MALRDAISSLLFHPEKFSPMIIIMLLVNKLRAYFAAVSSPQRNTTSFIISLAATRSKDDFSPNANYNLLRNRVKLL